MKFHEILTYLTANDDDFKPIIPKQLVQPGFRIIS